MEQSQVLLLLGFVGLVILAVDVALRLKHLYKEDHYAKERTKNEKELLEYKKNCFDGEMNSLKETADVLATKIKNELIDSLLLSSHKADSNSYSESLFNDRLRHHIDEKKFLVNEFVPLLMDRCEYHIKKYNKKICLLVDSGTTMFEFLKRFSEEANLRNRAIMQANEKENWMERMSVVTNNIPGIMIAMEKGRLNRVNRFSEMSFECHLLQGKPLSTYGAVIGEETEQAIEDLIEKGKDNTTFIGITVGNWVRIRRNRPCAIPMARGDGHLEFKQKLIEKSDEVFIISPLGKIITNRSKDEVNNALGLSTDSRYKQPYGEVNTKNDSVTGRKEDDILAKIKLVTTDRLNNRILHKHASILKSLFINKSYSDNNDKINITKGSIENIKELIIFQFDDLPKDIDYEKKIEFPHKETRTTNNMRDLFNA